MDCDMFAKLLENYENLTEQEKAWMDSHADKCPECKRELDFMASILSSMKTFPEIEGPADFLSGINAELDKYEKKTAFSHFMRNWQKYSAAAACMALLAVVGVNGDFLVDRMSGNDGGIISEEKTAVQATAEPKEARTIVEEKADNTSIPQDSSDTDGNAEENALQGSKNTGKNTDKDAGASGKSYGTSEKSVSGGASDYKVFEKSSGSASGTTISGSTGTISGGSAENTSENVSDKAGAGDAYTADTADNAVVNNATAAPEITDKPEDYDIAAQSDTPKIAEAAESEPLPEDGITAYSEDTEQDGEKARSGSYALNLKGTENKYAIASGVDNSGTSDGALMIASADYNRAMEIIMGYISSDGQGYYTAASDSFYSMLSELYNADIAFENLVTETGADVRFKIMSY